jgi:hypothetical protein
VNVTLLPQNILQRVRAVYRQRLGKSVPGTTDTHATIKVLVDFIGSDDGV